MRIFTAFLTLCLNFHLYSSECSPSQEYEDDFVALIEMVYGEGLLSQGGISSIDEMFEGIDLDGLKLLDLGCGLGKFDIYLATNHSVEILGIDPQEKLIKRALNDLERYQKNLKGRVFFQRMRNPNDLKEFPDNSFDIIFSKEALLHVPLEVKESYFAEVHRVLKPGGKIVLMDWMRSGPTFSENTQKMMEMDGIVFQLLTPLEYQQILEKSGFEKIQHIDTTHKHALLSQENIATIMDLEELIKVRFGEDTYNYSIVSWGYQKDAFQTRDLLTGIFKAVKK